MKDELLLKLVDIAEKGGGLKLHDDLLKRASNFSQSEIFRVGCARSGGEAGDIYVRYRTIDGRGNYRADYFDLNGMNGKGGLKLLSVYTRGSYDWIYLGSFMIMKEQDEYKVVGHGGLNDTEIVNLIRKTISVLEEKLPVPTPVNGSKFLLEHITKSKQRPSQGSP
jgi:hypothetical protein